MYACMYANNISDQQLSVFSQLIISTHGILNTSGVDTQYNVDLFTSKHRLQWVINILHAYKVHIKHIPFERKVVFNTSN